MHFQTRNPRNWFFLFLIFCVIVVPLSAHAILVTASPAAGTSVSGPQVPLSLRFNSRIDAKRSRLTLVRPDKSSALLEMETQASPDSLNAVAKDLVPGSYTVRWQVLASDGHITRGQYAFQVK
jgi:methionine-rich copper-binding protein CopC